MLPPPPKKKRHTICLISLHIFCRGPSEPVWSLGRQQHPQPCHPAAQMPPAINQSINQSMNQCNSIHPSIQIHLDSKLDRPYLFVRGQLQNILLHANGNRRSSRTARIFLGTSQLSQLHETLLNATWSTKSPNRENTNQRHRFAPQMPSNLTI